MQGIGEEREGRPASIVLEALHDLETVSRPDDAESDTSEPGAFHGTQPAVVTLLQSTLRSSQSRLQRVSTSWMPISGHWAVEIRGEVFELNRATTWTGGDFAARNYHWVIRFPLNYINQVLQLSYLPFAGAQARIDISDLEDYLAARGEHTITRSRFGTIDTSQRQIKEASMSLVKSMRFQKLKLLVRIREEKPLFYSFYSSNCQHFIIDLCESVDLEFSPSSVHALWLKSRLAYLLGGMIQFGMTLMVPLLIAWGYQTDRNRWMGRIFDEFVYWIVGPFVGFFTTSTLLWAATQPVAFTFTGRRLIFGSCYTGPWTRAALTKTPYGVRYKLCQTILTLEGLPYLGWSFMVYATAIFVVLIRLLGPSYIFTDFHPLYLAPQTCFFEMGFYVLICFGFGYIFWLQRRQPLRRRMQDVSHSQQPSLLL
jgi:hypothetical protein